MESSAVFDLEKTADTSLNDPVGQMPSVDSTLLCPSSTSAEDGVSITQTDSTVPEDAQVKTVGNKTSYLLSKIKTLDNTVQQLNEELDQIKRNKISEESKQEQEVCSKLESLTKELKEAINQHAELMKIHEQDLEAHDNLKVNLAKVEKKYQEVMDCQVALKYENSDLKSQVDQLQDTVLQMRDWISKLHPHRGRARRDNSEKGVFTDNPVQPIQEMRLRASLAESEKKYQVAKETIDNLKYHITVLRRSCQELEKTHSDAEVKCDALKEDRDHQQEINSVLRKRCDKLKEILSRCDHLTIDQRMDLGLDVDGCGSDMEI